MIAPRSVTPDLATLVGLFYDAPERLGEFTPVDGPQMPAAYGLLLNHQHHMTVTVERFHGGLVDVTVLDKIATLTHYSRKILLSKQSDRQVVQFGIVRLHLAALSETVRDEILAQQTPLGRVLIKHHVMREIHLSGLWQVTPGEDLCQCFSCSPEQITYGRTALIFCDNRPAIELLEIVAPLA